MSLLSPWLVLLVLAVVAVAWKWSTRGRVEHVSCAACRYTVAFTPSRHCPECGADLLGSGVVTPSMGRTARRPQRTVAEVVSAIMLAGIAAWVAVLVALALRPPVYLTESSLQFDRPDSGAYQAAEVRVDGRRRGHVMTYREVCFRIVRHDGTWSEPACFAIAEADFHYEETVIRLDASTTAYSPSITPQPGDPPGRYPIVQATDVPIEDLRRWADDIGLDVTSPQIQGELDDLIRVATEFMHTQGITSYDLSHFSTTQFHSHGRTTQMIPPVVVAIGFLAGAIVLLGLIWLIVRKVKKETRQRQAAAAEWLAEHDA